MWPLLGKQLSSKLKDTCSWLRNRLVQETFPDKDFHEIRLTDKLTNFCTHCHSWLWQCKLANKYVTNNLPNIWYSVGRLKVLCWRNWFLFTETKCSLPCTQQLTTGPYTMSVEFTLHITPYFLELHFNIILSSTPASPKWCLFFRLSF
jgi:hypothetical protein